MENNNNNSTIKKLKEDIKFIKIKVKEGFKYIFNLLNIIQS